ncbi:MAG: response regulator transcription factor [Thermoanaerobaculia bacterium]
MISALPPRVAVVDDEPGIRQTLEVALCREGFAVDGHADGLAAWNAFEVALPDVVVLDIVLPRIDGLELLRRLRARSRELPILMLTSKGDEFDRVLGLEMGADDYLSKPFSVRELIARLRVLLRRAQLLAEGRQSPADRILDRGRIRLDLDRYEAICAGIALPLTISEFLLLVALARRAGHVRSRDQLLDEVHGDDDAGSGRTIDSHIKRLRRKLDLAMPGYDPIEAVYGLGYRFRTGD